MARRCVAFIDAHWRPPGHLVDADLAAGLRRPDAGAGPRSGDRAAREAAAGDRGRGRRSTSPAASPTPSSPRLPDRRRATGPRSSGRTAIRSRPRCRSLAQLADAQGDAALLARVRGVHRERPLADPRRRSAGSIEIDRARREPRQGRGQLVAATSSRPTLILARHGVARRGRRCRAGSSVPISCRRSCATSRGSRRRPATRRWHDATSPPASAAHGACRRRTATGPIGLERIKFNLDIVGGVVASLAEVAAAGWSPTPPGGPTHDVELRHRTRTIHARLRGQRGGRDGGRRCPVDLLPITGLTALQTGTRGSPLGFPPRGSNARSSPCFALPGISASVISRSVAARRSVAVPGSRLTP